MNEWTIIRDIQLCPKKPIATAAGKPTFDCVPCNKSFPKIDFLFVLSICLPPRLLSSLSSLIVIPCPTYLILGYEIHTIVIVGG